ncbi:putative response regulatory protein [compost metagenome]
MYKLFFVDDELLVRTNLKMLIPWSAYGFTVCGEASGAAEALRLIPDLQPDIVLTDIRMPGMSGLDLIRLIGENHPDIRTVVLSNYDDFDYVRVALQNGAVDYILKHRLDKDTILNALSGATKMLQSNPSEPRPQLGDANQLLALKKKFLVQLIAGFHFSEEEIQSHIRILGIHLHNKRVVPVLASVDDYKMRTAGASLHARELEQFSIVNITEELLAEYENGAISHIEDDKFLILFSFPHTHSQYEIDQEIGGIAARISNAMKKFLNRSVSFSIGPMCPTLKSLPQSYQKAEEQLRGRYYLGKNVILRDSIPLQKPMMTGLDVRMEKQLGRSLLQGDLAATMELLEQVFASIYEQALTKAGSQLIFNDLLGVLLRICKEKEIELESLHDDRTPPYEMLDRMETFEEFRAWFYELFSLAISKIHHETLQEGYTEYVHFALRYISKHFAEQISLNDIAEPLKISVAYLSTLFKQEVGIGFAEYLSNVRVEQAKALLTEHNMDIKEIAEHCGFMNYNYFFNVFKKKTGLTPGQYLKESEEFS